MEPEASLWKTLMKFIASIGKKPDSFPRFDNSLKHLHGIINNYSDAKNNSF